MKLSDVRQGDTLPGDCGNAVDVPPPWMDIEKFRRGRQFFLRHASVMVLAMHLSLVSGLAIINLLTPLVFTKKSDTPQKAFSRYFQTFLHLMLWHVEDVLEAPDGKAHKSIKVVRRMHNTVAVRMNKKKQRGDKMFLSQYDMGLVQSGFFGAIIMYPEEFGLRCSQDELDDYVFFWRVIGYLLGVDDKYNICASGFQDVHDICKEIERDLLLPSLVDPPEDFEHMSSVYVMGTNIPSGFNFMSKRALFAFMAHGWGQQVPRLGIFDTLRYLYLKMFVFLVRWCPLFETFLNKMTMRGYRRELHQLNL